MSQVYVGDVGMAVVQDLGRPGVSALGISANGAPDQYSARVANLLVGNRPDAALLETLASGITLTVDRPMFLAVTGAVARVLVDDRLVAQWLLFSVPAGGSVSVSPAGPGLRTYIAMSGMIRAPRFMGSAAPDRALEFETRLEEGCVLSIEDPPTHRLPRHDPLQLSRLDPAFANPWRLEVCPGPEFHLIRQGPQLLRARFVVGPASNHVGIRLDALDEDVPVHEGEVSSRGVAIGAIEITPARELVLLHRGRSITAGYPVVLVTTQHSLSAAGQVRPGDEVQLRLTSFKQATARFRDQQRVLQALEHTRR